MRDFGPNGLRCPPPLRRASRSGRRVGQVKEAPRQVEELDPEGAVIEVRDERVHDGAGRLAGLMPALTLGW